MHNYVELPDCTVFLKSIISVPFQASPGASRSASAQVGGGILASILRIFQGLVRCELSHGGNP